MLVFVHIPKTAGMSLAQVIRRQFSARYIVNLNAPDTETLSKRWRAMPASRRASAKCVYGHFPLDPTIFDDRQVEYVTMLRDPVERCVSGYYYALRRPEHGLHAALNRERITLDQFVHTDYAAEFYNAQTRMLSGTNGPTATEESLERAKENLDRLLAVTGLTERFEETLLLCGAIFGWNRLAFERINVNRWRPALRSVSSATLARLESANSLDRALYSHAQRCFEKQLFEHGISREQILRLRRLSRVYGAARRTLTLPYNVAQDVRTAIRRRKVKP